MQIPQISSTYPKINPPFATYAELEISSQQDIQQGVNTKRKKHDAERKMTRRFAKVGDMFSDKTHHLPAKSGENENNENPEQSVKRRRSDSIAQGVEPSE